MDTEMKEEQNKHHLTFEDREIILLGTAHVSKESAEMVEKVIHEEKPDTVCIELCQSRYQALTQKNKWQDTDLIKVIREKRPSSCSRTSCWPLFRKRSAKNWG